MSYHRMGLESHDVPKAFTSSFSSPDAFQAISEPPLCASCPRAMGCSHEHSDLPRRLVAGAAGDEINAERRTCTRAWAHLDSHASQATQQGQEPCQAHQRRGRPRSHSCHRKARHGTTQMSP